MQVTCVFPEFVVWNSTVLLVPFWPTSFGVSQDVLERPELKTEHRRFAEKFLGNLQSRMCVFYLFLRYASIDARKPAADLPPLPLEVHERRFYLTRASKDGVSGNWSPTKSEMDFNSLE